MPAWSQIESLCVSRNITSRVCGVSRNHARPSPGIVESVQFTRSNAICLMSCCSTVLFRRSSSALRSPLAASTQLFFSHTRMWVEIFFSLQLHFRLSTSASPVERCGNELCNFHYGAGGTALDYYALLYQCCSYEVCMY